MMGWFHKTCLFEGHFLGCITLKLNFQQQVVASDCPRECRNPQTNPPPRTGSQTWATPGFDWMANKESLRGGPQMFPASDRVCGRCSSAGKDTEEIEQPEEDGAGQLSASDALPRPSRRERGETRDVRKLQHHRALNAGSSLHGDPVRNMKNSSTTGHLKSSLVTEKGPLQESFISQVPLRLKIKVSGQRGSLGISIAGGKGSLPYREHDEGVFISRVTEGGPSEKAGIHVGDRLLEVDGINMQGATHHEAVSALRNVGSCMEMKVVRERLLLPREVRDLAGPQEPPDVTGRQPCSQDGRGRRSKPPKTERAHCLSEKIEAAVCNGKSDLESDLNRTLSEPEASLKKDSLQLGKHTMTIPRIILTHPSISDEDVELLTQSPSRGPAHGFDIPDRHVHPDSFDSAFYPP
ncbi:protein scribble homolog [Scophthalmus maximus]|uniref:protein scribble homolog n=1 Tax=Scophthalmus maximus TaxID=52904 RepID=UPI001FA905B9|nr:protein scribble homolog [Scophthalmus maximus]